MPPLEGAAAAPVDQLTSLLDDVERFGAIFESWDAGQRAAALAYARAVEALHGAAIRKLVSALKSDPGAMTALKSVAGDELVYSVLRRHNILKPSLNERIEAALESVRPALASHGGDVTLVNVAPPIVELRFIGACDGCAASQLTFQAGVRKAVRDTCPEITDIRQVKGLGPAHAAFVSPFAQSGATWIDAGHFNDISDGGIQPVTLSSERLLLWRSGENVTCYSDACAHLGLSMAGGEVRDGIIACPHHGFEYDLATGECLTAPQVQLQSYAVRVTDGRVQIRLNT